MLPPAPTRISGIDAVGQFSDAARKYGLGLQGYAIADDQIHRVADLSASQKINNTGWYLLAEHEGVLFGSFGSWKRGQGRSDTQSWCSKEPNQLTARERDAIAQARVQQALKIEQQRAQAAQRAEDDIQAADVATDDHPYLISKGVKAHGLLRDLDKLLIPISDASGKVISYQTIAGDGKKLFLAGGKKSGGFFIIGQATDTVYVCEGYATAASVYEATGSCTVVAFDAGNLAPVVTGLRDVWPRAEIVICADNDASGAGLDGARKARPDRVVLPPGVDEDWNDVAQRDGLEAVRAGVTAKEAPVMASGFLASEMASVEPRKWLYGRHLIRSYVSATVSPGGVGKTTLELTEAIALATGRDLLGYPVRERVKVWHYNLEDPRDELLRRVWAICQHFDIEPTELEGWLFLDSGRDRKLIVAEPIDGVVVATPAAEQVINEMNRIDIAVLQVDPFVKSHWAGENDNKEIDAVLDVFGDIAKRCNAAVDLVHHTRKPPSGFVATAGDINTARGAGALAGAVRSARTITPMTDKEAEVFEIESARKAWYVRVDDAKGNMSAPAAEANWYERESVELSNGDYVGVLGSWSPPDPFAGLGVDGARRALLLIGDGLDDGQRYTWTQRSAGRWAGQVLVDMGIGEATAKVIINAWKQSGVLFAEKYKNPVRRREEDGLFVDNSKLPGVKFDDI